jgi:predicted metal-dependent HD superfamily phosphohydrolase
MDNLVKSSSEFVSKFLMDNLPAEFTYHNLEHTLEVFEAVTELGANYSLPDEEMENLQTAAWFHDTGFVKGYTGHEYKSVEIAEGYLKTICCPDARIARITGLILVTELANKPENLSEEIIRDADILHIGKENFFSKCLTLKSEREIFNHEIITKSEWLQTCLDFISQTTFFTQYANQKFEAGRQSNIASLKGMLRH